MMWNYQEIGISRADIETRILQMGFIPNNQGVRGWIKPIPKGVISKKQAKRRIHIIPSSSLEGDYLEIHIDTPQHKQKGGKKAEKLLQKLIEDLTPPHPTKLIDNK